MMDKITADMLPDEGGPVIKFFFAAVYPDGATIEELKNSDRNCFRKIGAYFEKKEVTADGNIIL